MAVLGQACLQLQHALQQEGILRQRYVQLLTELAILGFESSKSLILVHAFMVRLQLRSA